MMTVRVCSSVWERVENVSRRSAQTRDTIDLLSSIAVLQSQSAQHLSVTAHDTR